MTGSSETIYLSLGSNLGHRLHYLQQAVELLKKRCLTHVCCSIVLETGCILPPAAPAAWNKPFLNMVVSGQSHLSPEALLTAIKQIERESGRPEQYERWSPRIIDIDIIWWEGVQYKTPALCIPHPELANRPFLLHLLAMQGVCPQPQLLQGTFQRAFCAFPRLVGVVNMTADSFSDGGLYTTVPQAVERVRQLSADGATMVEMGAQSTRLGATLHGAEYEYRCLQPVLDALQDEMQAGTVQIYIDTFWPEVMRQVVENYAIAGINNVTGTLDAATVKLLTERNCQVVLMHSLHIPARKDICLPLTASPVKLLAEWAQTLTAQLQEAGLPKEKIILDPGVGFNKSAYQDLAILRQLAELKQQMEVPLLLGHSRKSYMHTFTHTPAAERDIETLAVSALLQQQADFLRVHNVAAHQRFFVAQQAIQGIAYAA